MQKHSWGKFLTLLVLFTFTVLNSACTSDRGALGTEKNPIKMFFVPSVEVKVIEDNSKAIKDYLEANTPYKYKISIPASFIAVVEAFGTNRADVAAINTFGYILANEKYGVQAKLTVIRFGDATYRSQFIAKTKSAINSIDDLAGKKVAFVDPASTSGYLLPLKLLKDKNVKPKETVFAMRHDSVVSMVYQGQVDAGATFYVSPANQEIQDARRLVKTQYPDVEEKIKIVELTDTIPNDPIVFRKDLPEEMKKTITDTFIAYVKTPEGRDAFEKLYGVTDLKLATDADYDKVRELLKSFGKSATELMK